MIMGNVCTGKSYLARRLSEIMGIDCMHLDDYYWYGDWKHITMEDLVEKASEFAEERENWIVEGNYFPVHEHLWEKSTCIIYCYNNLLVLLWRAIKRSLSGEGVPKNIECACQKREPTLGLLKHIIKYNMSGKKQYNDLVKRMSTCGGTICLQKTNYRMRRKLRMANDVSLEEYLKNGSRS